MNYHEIKKTDSGNGPGVRVSVFFSGCSLRCPGCFNSKTWDKDSGQPFTQEIFDEIIVALKPKWISGLSLLGGDPLEEYNLEDTLTLIQKTREEFGSSKSIWLWTGRTLEALQRKDDETINQILEGIDILIDGPFVADLKDTINLTYGGSKNQRLWKKNKKGQFIIGKI